LHVSVGRAQAYRRLNGREGLVAARALLTGFTGYGGRERNPAGEIAQILNGRSIAGFEVVGTVLPVSYSRLRTDLCTLIEDCRPSVLISLGLCPGEPVIRLERVGINIADFDIPDNDGAVLTDTPIDPSGVAAALASLPLRSIELNLLKAGIPARISSTAGTYLCNAALYTALTIANGIVPLVGFIHLPYVPQQVAEMLHPARGPNRSEPAPSMALETMVRAVEIALNTCVATITAEGEAAHRLSI
jgi:pyroglutamyl-peptidase